MIWRMTFAEVALNLAVDATFHYRVPHTLTVKPGHLVRVGFRTSDEAAVVVSVSESLPVEIAEKVKSFKPVLALMDPEPVVTAAQIEMARWLSRSYWTPLGQCIWLMLPPGLAGHHTTRYTLMDMAAQPDEPIQAKVVELLRKHHHRNASQVKIKGWQTAMAQLIRAGLVKEESVLLPPSVKPRKIQVAALALHPDRIQDVRRFLGKPNRVANLLETLARLQDERGQPLTVEEVLDLPDVGEATLNALLESGAASLKDGTYVVAAADVETHLFNLRGGETDMHILRVLAREDKPVDVSWVYAQTGASLADLKRLEAQAYIQLGSKRAWRDSLAERDFVPVAAPYLTSGQRAVWGPVSAALDSPDSAVFLLHGVTGSGKTEIYLRAVERVLDQGRQAILLVPEIALTAQTVRRVMARFPGRVAVLQDDEQPDGQIALAHSKLSTGERYDTWQRARSGQIGVVVGTRLALFMPLPDTGLVILDEEHDTSYKQSPPFQPPYYHAREVAEYIARSNNATLILGSATPDVASYYRARGDKITYLSLPDRIMGHRVAIQEQAERVGVESHFAAVAHSDALTAPMPPVEVVDMRDELKAGNREIFSRSLMNKLDNVLARGEQAILFLNRRGKSTYVFCRDCGYVVECPRCDTPMIDHVHELRCHFCGYTQARPSQCPQCGSRRIRYFGAGTQEVEEALHKHFPLARSLRWDADTAAKPGAHDIILQRYSQHEADVLIGTQMIAKGLDLPFVTLVGVVSADVGLNLPDFRAGERTFQTLAQVAGRAGRGLLGGQVVLQTYQPDHYAIKAAADHDYAAFYQHEIAMRRRIGYPPFRRMVRLLFLYDKSYRAEEEAQRAAAILRQHIAEREMTGTEIIGPVPCFFERINRIYRWQLLLRGPDPTGALDGLELQRGWHVDIDPVDVL